MDNYMMMNDMIQSHQERMMNLKKYYPFFRLMDTGMGNYRDGRYAHLDMAYLVMAILRFFIECNHFHDEAVRYEDYAGFMKGLLRRDFPEAPGASEDDALIQYIFDKVCNEGRPFVYNYYDPVDREKKTARVRLVENELKDRSVLYRISSEAVAFYLETKEVQDESSINVAQLLLAKMIKSRDFKGGMDVIGRINMEVGRLLQEKEEIRALLHRHVTEGLEALEAYHDRLLRWFEQEQKMFASNMELSAQAIAKMEAEHVSGSAAEEVYALDTALKNATRRHASLMHAYMEMQKAGDEALQKAKRTRFRTSVDFGELREKLIETGKADLLGMLAAPLFAPKTIKTFNPARIDDLLLYKPEEQPEGEIITPDEEQMYVYADEVVEQRVALNYEYLLKVLFDQLKAKGSFSLEYLNYLYSMKYSRQIFSNGDLYSFLVHLSQKDYYDTDMILKKQDTFLEGMIGNFLEKHSGEYNGLKFRLIFLPEETVKIGADFELGNIRFEKEDA